MLCHPWFEVSDRRKIRFRNVQIKVLLVFEQGRPLQVSTSFDHFWQFLTSFDQFWPVLTSFDQFWLVSIDTIQDTIVYGISQLWLSTFFQGGSLLLPTSVIFSSLLVWIGPRIDLELKNCHKMVWSIFRSKLEWVGDLKGSCEEFLRVLTLF